MYAVIYRILLLENLIIEARSPRDLALLILHTQPSGLLF